MKIALLADVHLGDKRFSKIENNKFLKIEHQKQSLIEFQNYVIKNEIEEVFIAGDLLDSKILNLEYINFLIDWLNYFEWSQTHVRIIAGNHEAGSNFFSLDFLKNIEYEYIHYYNEPKFWFIENFSFLFFPFVNQQIKNSYNIKNEQELLNKILKETNKKTIIIAHSHDAMVKIRNKELRDEASLDFDSSLCPLFITGHIHDHQIYKKKNTEFIYIGALNYLDFGDSPNNHRGFLILDLKENFKYEIEKIKLKNEIKYYTFELEKTNEEEINKKVKENDSLKLKIKNKKSLDIKGIENKINCKNIFFEEVENENTINIILNKELSSNQLVEKVINESEHSLRRKKQLKMLSQKIIKGEIL